MTTRSESSLQREKVTKILAKVASQGDKFTHSGSDEARQQLINSARELVYAAESPVESLLWHMWSLPTRTVAARIAVDLKLFETAIKDEGRAKTNTEFAEVVGASPDLVKRITRACASMKMLEERGPGVYGPTEITQLLVKPEYEGGIIHNHDTSQTSFAQLPTYLEETKWQNPQNPRDGPFQYANQGANAFAWVTQRPRVFQAFHGYVHALRTHRPSWTEFYPVKERLVEGLNPKGDSGAFVDVGGGIGQILGDFKNAVPEYPGKLVLQELPEAIEAAKAKGVAGAGIELQVHDFFTRQPVKGARAYFMRSVMHDWPDDQCRRILSQIKDVMEPGYSKILISDCIVADENPAWQHISLDIFMMGQLSAQERTRSEWLSLIESCGLKISGFYNKGEGNEGLIEVVLE